MTTPTRPLPADFPRLLKLAQIEAANHGHTDIAYLLEMAFDLAMQRRSAKPVGSLVDATTLSATPSLPPASAEPPTMQ